MKLSTKNQILSTVFLVAVTFQMVNDQVFKTNCVQCHSKTMAAGKVKLDSYTNVKKFTDLVYNTVANNNPTEMPPPGTGKKLTEDQRNLVITWINEGAIE
jgi:mono/diheme cytochrome c family protein